MGSEKAGVASAVEVEFVQLRRTTLQGLQKPGGWPVRIPKKLEKSLVLDGETVIVRK
jgi:hypothetical protein